MKPIAQRWVLPGGAILTALIVAAWPSIANAQEAKVQRLGGGRYMTLSVQEYTAAGLSSLRFIGPTNLGGTVSISVERTDKVRVELSRVFKVPDEETAAEWERDITLSGRTSGAELTLELQTPRGAPWEGSNLSARAEMSITIPSDWDLTITARFLEFDLAGPFRKVVVDTEFGRVRLEKAQEQAIVRGAYTGIEMIDVRGDIEARTSYADLTVRGAITAADFAAEFNNSFGSITVERLAGAVSAQTQFAPIILREATLLGAATSLRGENSPITVGIVEFGDAHVEVHNSFAPVTVTVPRSLSARLSFAVGAGGRIHTEGLTIQTHAALLSTGRLEGICGTGRGSIDITVEGPGQIQFEGR